MKDKRRMRFGVRSDKKTDIAWCAGFFDGEGSVGTYFQSKEHKFKRIVASVNQKDKRLLDRFYDIIGFGHMCKTNSRGITALCFTSSSEVIQLYEWLAPYLGPQKDEQFKRAFKEWFRYCKHPAGSKHKLLRKRG